MNEEIINNIENAGRLERLYRSDSAAFAQGFNEVYDSVKDYPLAKFWMLRLKEDITEGTDSEVKEETESGGLSKKFKLLFTIAAALIAGTLIRLPDILGYTEADYTPYIRNNLAFFILTPFIIYYICKHKLQANFIMISSAVILISALFVNFVPWGTKSDTHLLSQVHMGLMVWILLGTAYIETTLSSVEKRIGFLKRNGDLAILTGIIIICGVALTGITQGLFSAIKIKIPEFYFKNIAIYGLTAAPFAANYLIENNPNLINRVAPIISKIFIPLILLMMTSFLIVLTFFANDPFNNRDELIVFNVLLVLNLAVIFFSFSERSIGGSSFYNKIIFVLSIEAIIINIVALSAIVFRLVQFGVSPNRIAVLGGNVIMFISLIIIAINLFKYIRNKSDITALNKSMVAMAPVYAVWAVIVSFIFPLIFWFK